MPASEELEDQALLASESEEERDAEEYRKLLALYDDSMRNLTEGEIVTRPGHRRHQQRGDRRRRLQVRRADPPRRVPRPCRQADREGRRRGRRAAGEDRGPRRATCSSPRPRPSACASGPRSSSLQGRQDHQGPRHRSHQGRPHGRRRRARLPAGLAGRHQAGQEPRVAARPGARVQGHQPRPPAQQHRAVAQGRAREGATRRRRPRPSASCDEGVVLPGVVKNITDYGVFIDLGGIDGLLHITDISWGRVNHPSEHFSVGDEVEVVGAQVRPRDRARLAGLQAAHRGSRGCWSTRSTRSARACTARSCQPGRLRRLRRDRGGRRGPDPRQRDVVDQEGRQPVQDPRTSATRSRRSSPSSTWTQRRISLSLRQTERNPWEELDRHPSDRHASSRARCAT